MSRSGSNSEARARRLARWRAWALTLLVSLLFAPLARANAEFPIHLILSDAGGAYQELADAFRAAVGPRRGVRVWFLADLPATQLQRLSRESALLVPVGLKAARALADNHQGRASVLMLMVPRASADRIVWPVALPRGAISAVYIDQPAERTLALVEAAFPGVKRVGVVVSEENADTVAKLREEAARRRIELKVETITAANHVARALRRVLNEAEVLLLVPDAIAINAENARNVLLTTYRFRIPVIGFSEGLARAGAVSSVYSSPAQIGDQGGRLAARMPSARGALPAAMHAAEFSLAFNSHVARSLGVNLAEEAAIRAALGAAHE